MVSEADVERLGLKVRQRAPAMQWQEKVVGIRGPSPRTVQVPKGIDPGFGYRPGATRIGELASYFTEKSARLSMAVGTEAVQRVLSTRSFLSFYDKPEGNFPVGVVSAADASKIKSATMTVLLSADTAIKQKREHPDIVPEDYQWVQQALVEGERIIEGDRNAIYILERDRYVAVIKATQTGRGLFLTSFRRLPKKDAARDVEISRLRKKGK